MMLALEDSMGIVLAAAFSSFGAMIVGYLGLRAAQRTQAMNSTQHGDVYLAIKGLIQEHHYTRTLVRSITRYHDTALFEADASGNLIDMNLAAERLLGMSLREASGTGWANAVHEDDVERVQDAWYNAYHSGTRFGPIEYRYGSTGAYVRAEGNPATDGDGNIIAWVAGVLPIEEVNE